MISISSEQIVWLEEELNSTNKPVVIFVHHSLADQNLEGNPWFEGRPSRCLIHNRDEVRKIIGDSKKVVAVINGHLHWNNISIHDGIPYVTIQSAIENFSNEGIPANTWEEFDLTPNTFKISVYGNDKIEYDYKFVG